MSSKLFSFLIICLCINFQVLSQKLFAEEGNFVAAGGETQSSGFIVEFVFGQVFADTIQSNNKLLSGGTGLMSGFKASYITYILNENTVSFPFSFYPNPLENILSFNFDPGVGSYVLFTGMNGEKFQYPSSGKSINVQNLIIVLKVWMDLI